MHTISRSNLDSMSLRRSLFTPFPQPLTFHAPTESLGVSPEEEKLHVVGVLGVEDTEGMGGTE